MKRTLCALATLSLIAGCGAPSSAAPSSAKQKQQVMTIKWHDGNPGVPNCPRPGVLCKSGYTVHDVTTGELIPVSGSPYKTTNINDQFEVRAEGENPDGSPASSPYTPVVVQ